MQEHQKNAQKVVDILDKARTKCLSIMNDDDMLKLAALGVETTINQLINRLVHQVGLPPRGEANSIVFENLKPSVQPDAASIADASVTNDDLAKLAADVEKAAEIVSGNPADIALNRFKTNIEILALRALAKKLGVPEYETTELNEAFIEAIKAAQDAQQQQDQLDKTATLALIAQSEDPERVKQLAAAFNDDEEVQDAAMNRMIELEN